MGDHPSPALGVQAVSVDIVVCACGHLVDHYPRLARCKRPMPVTLPLDLADVE